MNGTKKASNKTATKPSNTTKAANITSPNTKNVTKNANNTNGTATGKGSNTTAKSNATGKTNATSKGANATNRTSNTTNKASNSSKSAQKNKTSKSGGNVTLKNIFTELNTYVTLEDNHFNDDPTLKPDYNAPNMGLVNDPNYCLKADDYNLKNPDNVLRNMNFMTDYNEDGLPRKLVIKKMGYDVLPDKVSKDMNKSDWNKVCL